MIKIHLEYSAFFLVLDAVELCDIKQRHAYASIESPTGISRVGCVNFSIQVNPRREDSRSSEVGIPSEFCFSGQDRTAANHAVECGSACGEYNGICFQFDFFSTAVVTNDSTYIMNRTVSTSSSVLLLKGCHSGRSQKSYPLLTFCLSITLHVVHPGLEYCIANVANAPPNIECFL